jgi:methylated-DNA-[protein]-cysteine S-methyltransferase
MQISKRSLKSKPSPSETFSMKAIVTPLGKLYLVATETAIVALTSSKLDLKKQGYPIEQKTPLNPLLIEAEKQLLEYLGGKRKTFNLPYHFTGTDFQKKVWKNLEKIPFGKTWSYQDLAKQVGNAGAVRAVGNANGKNPICIFIPCHRVIRASGELGGYSGGIAKKVFLLKLESGARTSDSKPFSA